MFPLAPPYVSGLIPYVPGKSIEETRAKYGLRQITKLGSNENPFGPSPKAIRAAQKALKESHLYPVAHRDDLARKICEYHPNIDIGLENILLGNGSNELIVLMVRAFLDVNEFLLNAWPSFSVYRLSSQAHGRRELAVSLDENLNYDLDALLAKANGKHKDQIKLLFLANPNNPTGQYIPRQKLERFLNQLPEHIVVAIDEAYVEYATQEDYDTALDFALKRPRTVVLRTFSKIFGLAGLRLGYAIGDPHIISILHRIRDPFNVNNVAQAAAIGALEDTAHLKRTQANNAQELPKMRMRLQGLGIRTHESAGNFVLMQLPDGWPSGSEMCEMLLRKGVIVRNVDNYDLPRCVRVTIGTSRENTRFIKVLTGVCK